VSLCVAENKMNEDLLVPKYQEAFQGFPPELIYYQATSGQPEFRKVWAEFLTEHLNKGRYTFQPENLIVGAGCNSMIENIFFCITEPGDAVLLPRPYYAAFEFDIQSRVGAKVFGVQTSSGREDLGAPQMYYPSTDVLEKARNKAISDGLNPKVLLLCTPSNPLAICYPRQVIEQAIDWAYSHNMHLVSDEIYGAGIHDSKADFVSVSRIIGDRGKTLGDKTHIIYALSKDFCSSGLRCGVLYTENEEILRSVNKLNDLCQMSSHTQYALTKVLGDKDWVNSFLTESNSRLHSRFLETKEAFEAQGLSVLPAEAGLFCWIDMRKWMRNDSWDAEMELYTELQNEAKVLVTPGFSMRTETPGFFRCCFATHRDAFDEALRRIASFGESRRT